jgi:hypothetical protein
VRAADHAPRLLQCAKQCLFDTFEMRVCQLDQLPHGRLSVYLSLRNIDARLLVLAA